MGFLDLTLGTALIGVMLNILFFGVMLSQCLEYYFRCERDPRGLKFFVAFVLLADTVNTVLDIVGVYHLLVTNFGRISPDSQWYQSSAPATAAIVIGCVQLFFAWRVKRLTSKTWLGIIIALLAVAQTLAGIGCSIGIGIINNLTKFREIKPVIVVWLAVSASNDIIIMGSMIQYLGSNRTGFAVTDDLISRIIFTTIQTGVLTTVWAMIDLILFLAVDNDLHVLFNFPLCKLYSNSLMSQLNERSRWESKPRAQTSSKITSHHAPAVYVTNEYTIDVERTTYPQPPRFNKTDPFANNGSAIDIAHRYPPTPEDKLSLGSRDS